MRRRKALKEKLQQLKKSRDFLPQNVDKALLKKVKEKVGAAGIDNIISSTRGARTIKNALHHKVNEYDINKLRNIFGSHKESIDGSALNKRFSFQYRGGWFFDLIANHKYKENPDSTLSKYFGVFLNGNSGWVKAYEVNKKNNTKDIYEQFIADCSHLQIGPGQYVNYPVKKIISDDDAAIPNQIKGVAIEKITQKGTSHGALSRINAFASHLRNYWRDSEYITIEQMNEFIDNWNNANVKPVNCSRNDMMADKTLEEAYICASLYHNDKMSAESEQAFQKGDEIKVRELRDTFIHNPQVYKKEKTATYRIETNDRGAIAAVNVNDPNDIINIRSREITGRVLHSGRNWRDVSGDQQAVFGDVEDEEVPQQDYSYHVVREKRTPAEQRANEKEAKIYKTSRNVAAARIRKTIEVDGMEDPQMRTRNQKKKEVRDLEEVWKNMDKPTQERIAKKAFEIEKNTDFDRGIFTGYSAGELYNAIDNFLNRMEPDERNRFLGSIEFYDKSNPNSVSKQVLYRIKPKLKRYFERPEHRAELAYLKNDLAAIKSGTFTPNKPGAKNK